jgi:tetratricopeptide (TPR) repeat protein
MQDMLEAPPIIEQFDKSSRTEDLDIAALDPKSMDCDIWPLNWSAMDIPGSPRLSRLFNALEIECSVPVPPMSLDTQIPEESQYISNTEMLDLWNGDNKSLLYELDVLCCPRQLGLMQASLKGQTRALPWRDPKLAFRRWLENPLNEIYVFPMSPTKALYQPPSSRKPLWVELETQAAELRIRLSKLGPLLGVEHPWIIAMMGGLAEIYISQGSYQKAEKLCRYVANATRKISGLTNLKTIAAWQKWVRSLLCQGQYLQARSLLSEMYSTILKLVHPDNDIATEATFLMARTALNLDDDEKAEGLLRQVLQIRLNTLGPRSHGTWISMGYLGYVLCKQLKLSEAEKLLRIAIQLGHELTELGIEEDLCVAMHDLSCTFYRQELYKESEGAARRAAELFEVSLGPEHPTILETHLQLARSIAAQGQYPESEDICRTVLKQQSKSLGESHPATLVTVSELVKYLKKRDNLKEAIIWYEKLVWGFLGVYGPDGEVIHSCACLGQLYKEQGQYDDAMELYRQFVERIRVVEGNDHPAIAEVQGWIK